MRLAAARISSALIVVWLFAGAAKAECGLRSGDSIWVELSRPVASYSSKPGQKISAVVLDAPSCERSPALPLGTLVEGQVVAVQKVGLGVIHERATVSLRFDKARLPDGKEIILDTSVAEVNNARETVRSGVIHGVLAADAPQGRITSRLSHLPTLNPYSDWYLLTYRLAFPISPEPEIYLPIGTEVRVVLNAPVRIPDEPTRSAERWEVAPSASLVKELQAAPYRTTTPSGVPSDLVNLALLGTRSQVEDAFAAAGWRPSDPVSVTSILKQFRAFLSFESYPTEPMTTQWLEGSPSDLTFQKTLDSYAKREHVRIWNYQPESSPEQVWLVSYTRETGAALSPRYHKFIHHVDASPDRGRDRLVNEFTLSGCVESRESLPRATVPREVLNATGDPMRSSGELTVVRLQNCPLPAEMLDATPSPLQSRPKSKVVRYIRSQILAYRSDLVRGNVVFSLFDLTRMGVNALRRRPSPDEAVVASTDAAREGVAASESSTAAANQERTAVNGH